MSEARLGPVLDGACTYVACRWRVWFVPAQGKLYSPATSLMIYNSIILDILLVPRHCKYLCPYRFEKCSSNSKKKMGTLV